ncbi:MAG: hypothetical protein HY043_21590 [Verrucomicrobia bacterium]|nr:hypothetical protein [Verrucomicrobiota bacterium]
MKDPNDSNLLVNRLILLVLTLILGCLAYLVFEKREVVRVRADKTFTISEEIAVPSQTADALVETQLFSKSAVNVLSNRLAQARRSLPTAISQPSPVFNTEEPKEPAKPTSVANPKTSSQTDATATEPLLGFVSGRAFLHGVPPPEKVIAPLGSDPICGKLHSEPVTTRFFVVSNDGALADVFIYIKAGAESAPSVSAPAMLDQVGCEYQPYIFGLQTGQKLIIKNSDPTIHNIHITPKLGGNVESNQALLPNGQALPKSFGVPELFMTFKCEVHPWMFAYACVVEHPYFAVTGRDGSFVISNLPSGKYTLAAIHRKAGELTREIVVGEGPLEPIIFRFELSGAGKQIADSQSARRDSF